MHRNTAAFVIIVALAALGGCTNAPSAEESTAVPAAAIDETHPPRTETAVLAGGCFWGVQGVFQHLKGVTNAVSGYAGGDRANAHYELVGTGTTGHAESVSVTFDPAVVSYGTILRVYFAVAHNPTQLNYQGPDRGTQYRSTIFPTSRAQARVARAYIAQLNKAHAFPDKVVTTVESGRTFYPAEAYHQNYLTEHPNQPYIAINDRPKVAALKQLYPALYRAKPVLVG
jgi:peptide-methionine (S)-S-oxide reductase